MRIFNLSYEFENNRIILSWKDKELVSWLVRNTCQDFKIFIILAPLVPLVRLARKGVDCQLLTAHVLSNTPYIDGAFRSSTGLDD